MRATNTVRAIFAYLAPRAVGIIVSGPRGEARLVDQDGPGRYCIVQAIPGGARPNDAQVEQSYSLRCTGPTDEDADFVLDAVAAAFQTAEGEPVGPLAVTQTIGAETRRWWLFRGELSPPAGPEPDPQSGWPTIVAVASVRWSSTEV